MDVPAAVDAFLGYWKPDVIILLESELWPNLIMAASEIKITLALINARMSRRSFHRWSMPAISPLITLMLSNFSLIVPLSMAEAIQFQLLQAPPFVISCSADLKYSVGECVNSRTALKDVKDLQIQLMHRQVWMASSVHRSEFQVMLRVHRALAESFPNVLTVVVPRHPRHGLEFALALKKQGFNVAMRSYGCKLTPATSIYVIDTLGELKWFYRMIPIAVIGGSFQPTLAGHNVSEAAAVGCAVLIGPYTGHFVHMVSAMKQVNRLSVLQVTGESELIEALQYLLVDQNILDARRSAAKQAFVELSRGTVAHVWELLNLFVLRKALAQMK